MNIKIKKTLKNLLIALGLSENEFNVLINLKHGFDVNWKKYHNYWKQIQQFLPNGSRICSKCGIILRRRFKSHLLLHGIQPKQWYNDLHGYEHDPLCPVCNKSVLKFVDKQITYKSTCCHKCSKLYIIHKTSRSNAAKKRNQKYGLSNKPEMWTDEQIKNRGFSGKDDNNYQNLINELQLKHDNRYQVSHIRIKRSITYKRKKKRNTKLYGYAYFPDRWTDEQIKANGFLGKHDVLYKRLVEDMRAKRAFMSSKAGKANNIKNGSNYSPGSWTDEQIHNRGYTGRDDPRYIELCKIQNKIRSKAGKENVKLYGFFGAPGSWTDEQIHNRGYTGRDDPRYIEKCHQKTQWSKRCGHITQKRYGCALHGWGI